MTQTPTDMVREFAIAMDHPLDQEHGFSRRLKDLRKVLVKEECSEVLLADKPVDLLKELADLAYVTYGFASTFGWDLNEAIKRVHTSNMSKLDNEGKPFKRPDGKVLKGPNYQQPDLSDLV
tara:strand:+ start:6517 stop:6879 length:363 start_codon:yes stop_codon:yes gene_type:complete